MAWFSTTIERIPAKKPYKIKVHIQYGPIIEIIKAEDRIETPGKLAWIDVTWDRTAYAFAKAAANDYIQYGITHEGVVYPAHRIWKVELIECEWKTELVEVRRVTQKAS